MSKGVRIEKKEATPKHQGGGLALSIDDEGLYGLQASAALGPLQDAITQIAQDLASHFYERLAKAPETAGILNLLTGEEFAHLQAKQIQHVTMMFAPDLTVQGQMTQAQQAGLVHAMVGVDMPMLIKAYALYQHALQQYLLPLVEPSRHASITRLIDGRLMFDLQAQTASYRRLETETALAISQIDQLIHTTANFPDLIRGVMTVIGNLDGGLSAFFGRVDTFGQLQIEASQGVAGQRYHHAMMSGQVPKISINPEIVAGQGPGGRAWRSGDIIVSDAWSIESRNKPWQQLGIELGFRSSAAVPLLDQAGKSIALLSLYSAWPGFFSTLRVRNFIHHVQRVLSYAIQPLNEVPVLALRQSQGYRRLLAEHRVTMLYQPIIDLRDGSLTKVEALARLIGDDSELIPPDRFLPALGAEELFALFQIGLTRACEDCLGFERQGIRTSVALNLPAEGVGEVRYEQAIFEALGTYELGPNRLQVEILESRDEQGHEENRQAFLQKLRAAGVRIAQDDLGSGHSSLLRLDRYGFDEVKIDQGFVRGAFQRPQRALEFILYLTRLAHAFATPLTVEGLEHFGMIEAAAILGAEHGQGYGIAKPMPAAEVVAWHRQFRYAVDPRQPQTALGALATYLLWDMQMDARGSAGEAWLEATRRGVEYFISMRGLEETELARLLDEHFTMGIGGVSTIRTHVIERFTEVWLMEVNEER